MICQARTLRMVAQNSRPKQAQGIEMKASRIAHFRIMIGAFLLVAFSPVHAALEAYLSAFSAVQGGELKLYISSDTPTVDLKIFQIGVPDREVYSLSAVATSKFAIPDQAWMAGAQWPQSLTFIVSPTWPSGLYRVALSAGGQDLQSLNFVVREDQPGSQSKILVLDNAATVVAYNNWGGKSTYGFNSTSSVAATSLSLLRPGNHVSLPQELGFARWTQAKSVGVEYASIMDLHADSALLDKYSAVILVAHSEYWTKEMRDNLERFLAHGGNAVILSGNTMWWQVRIEGDQLVCYKSGTNDPLAGVDNARVTTNWYASPVLRPENAVIGVSWRHGGYVNSAGFYPSSGGSGGYTVVDPMHWVFQGTGLNAGDVFGRKHEIVGYETDGALFNLVNGQPVVTGEDGTPLSFEILASAPAKTAQWNGNATMGMYKTAGGGYVFNASTVYWANGLWALKAGTLADATVGAITMNVIAAFGGLPLSKPTVPLTIDVPATASSEFNVSWAKAVSFEPRYELEQATRTDFSDAVVAYRGDQTSFKVTPPKNGTFYYRVRACNRSGCSDSTGPSKGVIADLTPTAPISLQVPLVASGVLSTSWTKSSGKSLTYELEQATQADFSDAVQVYRGPETSANLIPSREGIYVFRVAACNEFGCSSQTIAASAVSIDLPPAAPASLDVPNMAGGAFVLSWSKVGDGLRYEVEQAPRADFTDVGNVYRGDETSVSLTPSQDGTFFYRVRACDSGGCSAATNGAHGVTVELPTEKVAPTNLGANDPPTNSGVTEVGSKSGALDPTFAILSLLCFVCRRRHKVDSHPTF